MRPELKYPLWLALIAAGILGGGLALKPNQKPVEVISESERARLQEMAQKKNLQDMGRYFALLADRVAARVVGLRGSGASGVIVGQDGLIASSLDSVPIWGGFQLVGDFGTRPASIVSAAPDHPVVALHTPGLPRPGQLPVTAAGALTPGAWLVLVGREGSGVRFFIPGVYSGSTEGAFGGVRFPEITTNLPLSAATLGAGIFDIDGGLVAIVVKCGDRFAAIAADGLETQFRAARTLSAEIYRTCGAVVVPPDEAAVQHFRAPDGLLVQSVWRLGPGHAAGLRPGDVLTAVNEKAVKSMADLGEAVVSGNGRSLELSISRRGRTRKLVLNLTDAESTPDQEPSELGLTVYSPPPGVQVDIVTPGSVAEKAGILSGDRLLQIDGKAPTTPEAFRRALRGRVPRFLLVQRGPRELGILLPAN